MADAIGKPPAAGAEELLRPEAGFHDDKVGGQLKSDEAALRRAAQSRGGQKPRRIIKEPEQVAATSSFRGAQQESPEVAQIRRQRALVAGHGAGRAQAAPRAKPLRGETEKVAKRVQVLFAAMADLSAQHAAGSTGRPVGQSQAHEGHQSERTGGILPAGHRRVEAIAQGGEEEESSPQRQPTPPEPLPPAQQPQQATPDAGAAARLLAAEQQARYQVQQLLAGGQGFVLLADPAATFSSVFAQLPHWPTMVPPGHTPVAAPDFDAFLAWAFAPAEAAEHAAPE